MNLRDLEYVSAVAALRSFRKAAEQCFVSQPTLSSQVAKLEQELETTIFDRSGRRTTLTPAGREIVEQIRVILEEVKHLREIGKKSRAHSSGPLRLGAIPTVGPYLMARVLPYLRVRHPKLKLYISEDKTDALLGKLRDGELDFAFMSGHRDVPRIHSVPLFDEELLVAVPSTSPLAGRRFVSPKELDPASYIELEEGHCLRDEAVVLCRLSRPKSPPSVQATSLECARQMAKAGIGWFIVPAMAASMDLEGQSLVRYLHFRPPVPKRRLYVVFRSRAVNRPLLETLAKELHEHLKDGS